MNFLRHLLLIVIFNFFHGNANGQGYLFSKEKTSEIINKTDENFGFTGAVPTSYSLRKYAPTPCEQEGETCVGWSLAYAAMSITYNKIFNITDKNQKEILAFDPVFTYSMAKTANQQNCKDGIYFPDAIKQILNYGCKRLIMPPLFMNCEQSVYNYTDAFSAPFIPSEIYALDLNKAKTTNEKILVIKKLIAAGYPLPFGMIASRSLLGDGTTNSLSGGLWTPKLNEESIGGHAMCLIGFNDNKYNGAFEIMNSWGSDYGEKGFIWIKYSDFIQRVEEFIIIEPGEISTSSCKFGNCKDEYSSFILDNKDRYEGTMINNKPHGYGIYIWADKDFYAGEWKTGMREGHGLFFNKEGIFKCLFNNDELITQEPLGFADNSTESSLLKSMQFLEKLKNNISTQPPNSILEEINKDVFFIK
jgi:hypothetical protein